jgi:cytochrome bd-type quinol oxidase subunit 2
MLMWWLTKILVTVILLTSFIAIIAAWVMMTASGSSDTWASNWKKLIWSVITALALLWASWVILRLINPNFFG